jgi:hypothetical protein
MGQTRAQARKAGFELAGRFVKRLPAVATIQALAAEVQDLLKRAGGYEDVRITCTGPHALVDAPRLKRRWRASVDGEHVRLEWSVKNEWLVEGPYRMREWLAMCHGELYARCTFGPRAPGAARWNLERPTATDGDRALVLGLIEERLTQLEDALRQDLEEVAEKVPKGTRELQLVGFMQNDMSYAYRLYTGDTFVGALRARVRNAPAERALASDLFVHSYDDLVIAASHRLAARAWKRVPRLGGFGGWIGDHDGDHIALVPSTRAKTRSKR